ncbi:GNAT family N-acetyltransferase [Streptomyces sp. AC536]|uniref:GNAT family N-acetyltransferase n=1 Tax=Streptomyces buecherae TaxID=2763006 RepID=UPI00164D2C7D|nr:GNAT family protein [Streptomyces buecherae]MBC3986111.1 GNAT family N-acetyltransferase [Streptomyces buecherae]QNJ39470.1 GNAT family N-acetyltransferase [Streptomyces buecherae]
MIERQALATKPTLTGERLRLVPLTASHADAMYASTTDPETRRLTGTHRTFTPAQITAWCASRAEQTDRLDLAVEDLASGAYLGEMALTEVDPDNESAALRISLAPRARGRGAGPEAIRLLLDHAFGQVRLHRVWLEVFAFNDRARRAYERCGFHVEGRLRHAFHWAGERHDTLVMAALNEPPAGHG